MRIVSPMPSASSVPRPTADLSEPDHLVPGLGDARGGAGSRSAPTAAGSTAIVFGTLVDLIETLKSSKSSRSISSTYSTAAPTSASTGFSRSSSCRCLGSEPEFTPTRIGTPAARALSTTSRGLLVAADVAGVDADAVGAGVDRLERERVVEVDVGDHRDRRLAHDPLERLHVLVARDRAAHQVAARVGDGVDLAHGGVVVGGLRLRHRLDGDGRSPADLHAADVDLPLGGHCPQGYLRHAQPAEPAARKLRVERLDLVLVLLGDRLALELHRRRQLLAARLPLRRAAS